MMSNLPSDEDVHENLKEEHTDDSEAETEIVSRNQTPIKGASRDVLGASEKVGGEGFDSATVIGGVADSVRGPDRKRKPAPRAASEDDSTADASSDRGRRGAQESPSKKARLSPEADSQSDVEQRQRRREGVVRQSDRAVRSGRRVEINAGEGRSQSPNRSSHRRSTSFHSSAATSERERRSKRRFASHEESAHQRSSSHQAADSLHMARSRGIDRSGRTPLAQACAKYPEQVKELLTQSTEDIDKPDYTGNTPFQIAALEGNHEIMQMLIDNGAEIHFANYEGDTPLIDSVTNGHVSAVRMLLELGVNPLHKNREGKWASDFLDSIENKDTRVVIEDLLNSAIKSQKGTPAPTLTPGPANQATSQKKLDHITPNIARLREYAGQGHLPGVDFCLASGIEPDNASVVAAAQGGHIEILSILLGVGGNADPEPNKVKTTPMMAAIGRGNLEVVRMLAGASDFKVDRLVDGKHYWQIAEDRKGPDFIEEIEILKSASPSNTTKVKLKTKKRLARSASTDDADEEEEEVQRKRNEPRVKSPSSPPVSAQSSSPPMSARRRRLLSGREIAEEEREKEAERGREEAKEAIERGAVEAARLQAKKDEAGDIAAAKQEAARLDAKAEEAARLKAAEEESAKVREAAEEAAKIKAAEEEAARIKAAEEEAARLRAAEEETARVKAAEEEAARVKAAEEEAARVKAAEEETARLKAAAEAAKAAAEERALEEKRRKNYLASIPRALRAALIAGPAFPLTQPVEKPWIKTLHHYTTLQAVRRAELDPTCASVSANELYIMNWQAAVLLGHHWLDEGVNQHGWVGIPVTEDQRLQMWQAGMAGQLYKDAEWSRIPTADHPADHGCTIAFDTPKPGCNIYHWGEHVETTKALFLALPNDQLYWVKLNDFVAAANPTKCPRLRGVTITVDFSAHVDRVPLGNGKFGGSNSRVELPQVLIINGVQQEAEKGVAFSWATVRNTL